MLTIIGKSFRSISDVLGDICMPLTDSEVVAAEALENAGEASANAATNVVRFAESGSVIANVGKEGADLYLRLPGGRVIAREVTEIPGMFAGADLYRKVTDELRQLRQIPEHISQQGATEIAKRQVFVIVNNTTPEAVTTAMQQLSTDWTSATKVEVVVFDKASGGILGAGTFGG